MRRESWLFAGPVLSAAVVQAACGGGDPPTTPTSALQPTQIVAGTVLTVVSGETDQPIAGATLVIGDQRYTTDAAGEARLAATVLRGAWMDIVAPAFLDRHTTIPMDQTRFTLWPKTSGTGLDEHTTAELVYTPGSRCCPAETLAASPLRRVASTITTLPVVLDPAYRDNPLARAAIEDGMRVASAATQCSVVFTLGDTDEGPRVYVTSGPDPLERENVAAFAERTLNAQGYVTGGRVVFVREDYLVGPQPHRSRTTVIAHELGHILGLGHSSTPGVMSVLGGRGTNYAYFAAHSDFSPAEKLVLDLMYQRRAGTRFPDNDRLAAASAAPLSERVFCGS